jgi:hypothetical protein
MYLVLSICVQEVTVTSVVGLAELCEYSKVMLGFITKGNSLANFYRKTL